MASIKLKSYTDYLNSLGGLINWTSFTALPSTQQTAIAYSFNNQAQTAWIANNWLNVCPYGEARFVGNQGQYPNDLAKTSYWTATAVTVTANSIANPADGAITASKLLETTATSEHKVLQNYTYIPNATYQVTCYARPIGGRYLYLQANDGVNNYYTFFDVVSGTVGTQSNNLSSASTMNKNANGFWVCSIFFTSASGAGAGNFGPGISSDGSTTSYTGDAAKGLYVWGNVLTQTTYASPTSLLIPYDQLGEEFIDSVFQVWQMSPVGAGYPVAQGYQMMPTGVQIIGTNGWVWNGWLWTFPTWFTAGYPIYLYYRKGCPNFAGSTYSAMATYAVGDQILFTDSNSVQNFYKCVIATTAGQSPDTTPASWQVLQLPETLFLYVVYAAFADYLRMNAQIARAAEMDAKAQAYLDVQSDKQEREQSILPPLRMQTHVSAQARGWPTR